MLTTSPPHLILVVPAAMGDASQVFVFIEYPSALDPEWFQLQWVSSQVFFLVEHSRPAAKKTPHTPGDSPLLSHASGLGWIQ